MFEEVKNAIADKLGIDASTVAMETRFVEDLRADSLDMIDLITEFEDKYALEISNEDLQNLKTVGDIVNYLESHVK
ncbi:MAG: acyl carrier protein [Eubacteriales bacterium]|nr:acyl carrier protein [Eubacteriales bacterium]